MQATIFSQPAKWRGKKWENKIRVKTLRKCQEINGSLLKKYFLGLLFNKRRILNE